MSFIKQNPMQLIQPGPSKERSYSLENMLLTIPIFQCPYCYNSSCHMDPNAVFNVPRTSVWTAWPRYETGPCCSHCQNERSFILIMEKCSFPFSLRLTIKQKIQGCVGGGKATFSQCFYFLPLDKRLPRYVPLQDKEVRPYVHHTVSLLQCVYNTHSVSALCQW